jgi:hypothetical protein
MALLIAFRAEEKPDKGPDCSAAQGGADQGGNGRLRRSAASLHGIECYCKQPQLSEQDHGHEGHHHVQHDADPLTQSNFRTHSSPIHGHREPKRSALQADALEARPARARLRR